MKNYLDDFVNLISVRTRDLINTCWLRTMLAFRQISLSISSKYNLNAA